MHQWTGNHELFRIAVIPVTLVAAIFIAWQWTGEWSLSDSATAGQKNIQIQLMTSLPIVWGENASMDNILSGKTSPAPIYSYWQKRYAIDAVDSFEGLEKSTTDIVILAQPRAMDPADIAALDQWIRGGGNAIIFTDPMLVWPSDLPLGDPRRPLASGLLSPLLGHWGLELLAPEDGGPEDGGLSVLELRFDDFVISTVGVGLFNMLPDHEGENIACKLSDANIIAKCNIGKGRVTLIADADLLHDALWVDDPAWLSEGKSDAMRFSDLLIMEHHNAR